MKNIEGVLADYYNCWTDAFKTKVDTKIRDFMSKSFTGYWAFSGIDKPEEYDYHYDIVSVLNQYDVNTYKEFNVISITTRKNGENYLVLGTETSMISGQSHQAKCMYVWGIENCEWKLIREYIEMEN